MNMVMNEALRFMPVAAISTQASLSEDAKIGKYDIKAGVDILVNITGLHTNPAQW